MKIVPFLSVAGLALIFNLSFLAHTAAQTTLSIADVRTIDLRGKTSLQVTAAAIQASREDVIVVLIRGGDQELIDKTKGQVLALMQEGYQRIGVMLGDLDEHEEEGAVLGVLADGTIYAVIHDAKANNIIYWKIYNLTRDAYQELILPKLKN